jgi:hypothetical protein
VRSKLFLCQIALFALLAALNVYVYLYVGVESPTNPEAYCETTNNLKDDCIADLPGEFARGVIPVISVIIFLLFPLLYLGVGFLYRLVKRS